MRDVAITAILIFVLALLTLEHSSLIMAFFSVMAGVQLVWSKKERDSILPVRGRRYAIYINILLLILLIAIFSSTPSLLFVFIGAYIMGVALTYAAFSETSNS